MSVPMPPTIDADNLDPEHIKTEKCALNCLEKFLKANQRISQRFQEFQMIANENALAAAQKMGQAPS
ncbi:tim10/ddp family zinc finger [Holotrichia oblita]|uniref:Tim10/ddp family zinc finger n=1 Tax=Holotrichia oblita TaxID=644536 RepID=A0ACB9T9M1_HOLOL|nr:tim10/ddp family zinc finger [Holotrichia oblita]